MTDFPKRLTIGHKEEHIDFPVISVVGALQSVPLLLEAVHDVVALHGDEEQNFVLLFGVLDGLRLANTQQCDIGVNAQSSGRASPRRRCPTGSGCRRRRGTPPPRRS